MSFVEDLRKWRSDRNITSCDTRVYVANIVEELLEIYFTNKRVIRFLQWLVMLIFVFRKPISEFNTIDAISDVKVFSVNEVELMGYDVYRTMDETVKEISSREQDLDQKIEWEKNGAVGKWKKNSQQDRDTLYTADYSSCL